MALDTSKTALASQGGDGTDKGNGQAVVSSTYQSSNGDITSMSSNATAILQGFSVLVDTNATVKDKIEAAGAIEGGVLGLALFAEAGAYAATSATLISASTGLALMTSTIPLIGVIAAAVIIVATAILTIFSKDVLAAGNPINWTQQDQLNLTLYNLIKAIPNQSLPGAPFTLQSCQLAGICASYVNAQLAGTPKTDALPTQPSGHAFGYMADSASDAYTNMAGLLGGSKAKADALVSILSPLWDPRWPGIGGPGTSADPTDLFLNEAVPIDPFAGGSSTALQMSGGVPSVVPITNVPGLDASSYLCELAAAGMLANQTNIPGAVYAMVYTRLVQISWIYKTASQKASSDTSGGVRIAVPDELYSAIGFMLDLAANNNVVVMTDVAPTVVARRTTPSLAASSAIAGGDPMSTLAYWIHYYLGEA